MKKNKIIKYVAFAFMMFLANTLVAFAEQNQYIECGDNSIPAGLAPVTRITVLMLQIILPIAIIIVGSLDFLKAVIAGDQEGVKKNEKQFLNRLKYGAIFFFVIVIIKFVVSFVADADEEKNISKCIDCMINDESSCGSVTTDNPFIDTTPEKTS